MNYKKTTILLFTLIITSDFFSQGLKIYDGIDHNKNIKTAKLVSTRSLMLKTKHTLEKYLPYVHYQSGNECLSYSLSTCRTICYAIDNKYENINKISFESFSPHYNYISYKRATNDTIEEGMTSNFDSINEFGFCKIKNFEFPKYYPFSNKHLTGFPSLDLFKKEALKYKFSHFERIDLENKNKDILIKDFLQKNIPAVASFNPWPDKVQHNSKSWAGSSKVFKEKEDTMGHSVTLIGYDDSKNGGSFLIFNSWGENFGDNGKMWIPYKEFFKIISEVVFTFTDEIKDYENNNKYSKQGSNIISSNFNSENTDLSFDWIIRMPILNTLGTYNGDTNSLGERDGNGEFKAYNSATYKGAWKDDAPYGNGTAELNQDSKYIANWKNEFELPEFYESVYSSVFKYKGNDKDVKEYYVGGFKGSLNRNNYYGRGTLSHDGNIIYEGEWLNGEKSGKGTYYSQFSDGSKSKYQGEWLNNMKNGKGILYKDGKKYYEGEWLNGKRSGYGILYGPNWKYVGEFLNDKQNGKGTTYREDGSIYKEGIYKNGHFVK